MATKVIKGASIPQSELNAYSVGLLRLREIQIAVNNFKSKDIEFIGQCSIYRKKIIIGKIGNDWAVKGREKELERKYGTRYGGPKLEEHYSIIGKRSVCIYRDPYRDKTKPLHKMTAEEIFQACKGVSCPKHQGRGNGHSDIGKYK
ncbi:hypothetical protein [Lepagella muris]|uniref:Uncharacterized protein n=1 Tax=Lepagella muris TaxID=3032870 RepID=A0AC61RH69_9BACT|nr:hypothetical protein [Lepagella muris]TGY79045.1 hypothetical protein E5331_08250 [Lepagella muris]THG52486.1 hypothetical protein E5984_07525 [Bacteroidales bacterium]TKC54294.1 hypothetical protein E5359_018995 [Bacteroidales bacterium]